MSGPAEFGHQRLRKRTKTPSHAVAYDGVADFFGHRQAKPDRLVLIVAVTCQEHETRHGRAQPRIGAEKVRALRD